MAGSDQFETQQSYQANAATLDVADNNVSWIPFAQNAGTIEKAIAAKQTPQLHPATESASPNQTVFH